MTNRARGYALSFLLVLLAGLIGALVALQVVGPFDLGRVPWPDTDEGLQFVSTLLAQAAPATPRPGTRAQAATRMPTPTASPTPTTALLIPTPMPPTPTTPAMPPTAMPPAVTPSSRPTAAPLPATPTPAPAVSPTPESHYEFMPAGPVRHTVGGCAGQAIRGTVYDRVGNPLPGVRLWMYDQWANEAYAESKAGAIDMGQYDFPIFHNGPINLYVTVLGPDGSPISPTIEVHHRQGPQQAANCHWIDWKRTR